MAPTIPADAEDLTRTSIPVIVSFHDASGRILSVPLWVEHADGALRFSTPKGSRKTVFLRDDPEVGFLFTDASNPYRYLSVSGRVVDVHDDEGLATIDRLARRYVGSDYEDREQAREVFAIEPTRVLYSPGTWG